MIYKSKTNDIKISVRPVYLDEESEPSQDHYVWAYHVRIENAGDETIKIISRTWTITDGQGRVRKIEAPGIVGEQPTLEPGEIFEYTSGTPLLTASGYMDGHYRAITKKGRKLTLTIPGFFLESDAPSMMLH